MCLISPLARVRLADFVDTGRSVAAFHIGRIIFQMGSANILQAVRPGAAMPALYRGIIGNTLDAVIHSVHFKAAHMHFVSFNVTVHFSSLNPGAAPRF